ncbi:hypothetical protein BDN72DRAFT_322928 [Pluteus cervinus]|uniref:Uncharacterized protein n=1 Tax=Pluteus cervinus TaxID=181527 RepID=A0ACD3ACW3_9AGAR|nr:hypothetical protein BDN72DRAFT_322928 [Pluteus cervinus]
MPPTIPCPSCGKDACSHVLRIPAAPTHAHPLSAKKSNSLVNTLTQCHQCMKSKADGVTLFKCGGCHVDLFCSKECQKKAWPLHKSKCKLNQRTAELNPSNADKLKKLRAFTNKHRPTLSEAGIQALEVGINPENAMNKVLLITLRGRQATRAELSYFAINVEVVPIETFGPKAADMREQLELDKASNEGTEFSGMFFVVLHDIGQMITNIMPVGFIPKAAHRQPMPWKEWLVKHLNEGILN